MSSMLPESAERRCSNTSQPFPVEITLISDVVVVLNLHVFTVVLPLNTVFFISGEVVEDDYLSSYLTQRRVVAGRYPDMVCGLCCIRDVHVPFICFFKRARVPLLGVFLSDPHNDGLIRIGVEKGKDRVKNDIEVDIQVDPPVMDGKNIIRIVAEYKMGQ